MWMGDGSLDPKMWYRRAERSEGFQDPVLVPSVWFDGATLSAVARSSARRAPVEAIRGAPHGGRPTH